MGMWGVLAMIMIMAGGLEYMTTELISNKEQAKERIANAIFGLLLALGAYTILYTINPELLNTNIKIEKQTIEVVIGGESSSPFKSINKTALQTKKITCPGSGGVNALFSIAQSFIGKATYSQNARNTYNDATTFFDCSSFVAQVYNCAALTIPGNTTTDIFGRSPSVPFSSITSTKINGVELGLGDLIGWKPGEDARSNYGHVVMYIGNGKVIDSEPNSQNNAIHIRPLSQFEGRIKHIRKAPAAVGGSGASRSF